MRLLTGGTRRQIIQKSCRLGLLGTVTTASAHSAVRKWFLPSGVAWRLRGDSDGLLQLLPVRPAKCDTLKAAHALTAKTKIAIACQGGGSQTAFTAGALKALCEAQIADEFEIVSMSGTSGGAVCAVLLWYALERGADPPWQQLMDFWQDNSAKGWAEDRLQQARRRLGPDDQ